MQLTNTLCALILAVTVSSAALPNAEPIAAAVANAGWGCGQRGQPCGKTKREPVPEPAPAAAPGWGCGQRGQPCGKTKREPAPEPVPEAAPGWGCGQRGQPCGKVKRAAEAFAEALAEPNAEPELDGPYARYARQLTRDLASIVAETQDDPEAYFTSLTLRDDSDIDKRDALAEAGWGCGQRGQPCGKAKRDADPEAGWGCGQRGQPCGKLRRAAEAIAEAVAVPEPEAGWGCGQRGQPCGKAKRDALALAHAADLVLHTI